VKPVIAFLAAIAGLWGTNPALAQAPDDPTFGPRIVIEAIEIRGNDVTAERIIRRAIPVAPGDSLRVGDPRLDGIKLKVLALGYFRNVEVAMRKGAERGAVILVIAVQERGTVVLNRIYLGTTSATPYWFGADLGDRNFLGTGVDVGGAYVYAGDSEVDGGDSQWAAQLRVGASGMGGTPVGVHGAFTHVDASEPYRVAGAASDGDPDLFAAFGYTRTRGQGGIGLDVTALSNMAFDYRFERIDADVPVAPSRVREDGSISHVDLGLQDGVSHVSALSIGFDRDTRPDPILPFTGDRFTVIGEYGASWLGGDYDFGTVMARYERWYPFARAQHVLSFHLTGGLVLGEAPLFDRFYIGDINRLLSPRALGLVVSTQPSLDLLGTAAEETTYGEVAGLAEVQYAYRLFRRGAPIYGGDLFVGAGVFGLATREQLRVRDTSLYRALPLDLMFDVGLRLDTEIGIFELTVANGLGRIPL
jgi:outer membrane protein assembly factor BamA